MDAASEHVKNALSETFAAGEQPGTVTPLRKAG
jgi:hypothetical protein